jgi:small-conductance mechanosensitive channel
MLKPMKLLLTLFSLCVTLLASPGYGQEILSQNKIERQLIQLTKQVDDISNELVITENHEQKVLVEIREKLRQYRGEIETITRTITPVLQNIESDIADLGPGPSSEENTENEPDNIKKQRAALIEEKLVTEGLFIQSEALLSKSGRLLEKITTLRREKFINQFFEPQISVFDKTLWKSASAEYQHQFTKLPAYFEEKIEQNITLLLSIIFFILAIITSQVISKKQISRQLESNDKNLLSTAALSLITPSLAIILGIGAIYIALSAQGLITGGNEEFIKKGLGLIAFGSFAFFVTARLKITHLIRGNTQWLINSGVLIYVIDAFILNIGRLTAAPVVSSIAQSYISSSLFAILLAIFSIKIIYRKAVKNSYLLPIPFFWLLAILSFILLVANVFSYAALSRFIFERTVMISSLFITIMLIRALAVPFFTKLEALFQSEHQTQNNEVNQQKLLTFWLTLSLDIVLFFASLPIIALIVGADWASIKDWALQGFLGFNVGAVTISIANIVLALGLFLGLLFITKIIQKILSQKILPNTNVDSSVQQSTIQVIGYIGLIIALLTGISSVGFDLSNLALIAGALSVGIGFGLQSIVSNFVSGLILLFERPIKIGDWIITDSGEGIVKKINVRATEIETFDRTSILIPNAELISSSVKNWTHKDQVGRVKIIVGVSYNSDPHHVNQILIDYIENNDKVLKWPEPKILFQDFADSALIFELRFFIRNIRDLPVISTEVRFDIWDRLKSENIEISYPQRDLHIRSAPGLEGIFNDK